MEARLDGPLPSAYGSVERHTNPVDEPAVQTGPSIPRPGEEGWADLEWFLARWPTSAERAEFNAGPRWRGGPWDDRDLIAAERLFPGRIAVLGPGGYGLWLLADEEAADDLVDRLGPGARRLPRC